MDWDAFIRSHRLARALGLAVLLAGFLVWWRWEGDPGPVRATRELSGIIETVHDKSYLIRLDSGQTVRVLRSVSARAGDRVRVTVTTYASGADTFALLETGAPAN
jgi:hypothetical protein